MRRITLIFFLILMLACKKENKEPPVCRFTKIGKSGGTKLPITYYNGDTLVKVGETDPGYTLHFNTQGRLIYKEEPALNPYYHTEFVYNAFGQVTELRVYSRQGNNWVYDNARMVFTYESGRIINVREENAGSNIGNIYDHQITWQGNDIQLVEHRLNNQIICTTRFSYEGSIPNPMQRFFSYFYFCDGDSNSFYYKLPYYFSEHLVTKQEGDCSLSETRLFSYTFTSIGLIESMLDRGYSLWEYEYECR